MQHWLLSVLVAASLLGCGLGSDDMPGPVPGEDPPTKTDDPTQPTTTPGKLEKPVLDLSAIPAETCAKEVGIRGTAAPGASVFAFGGAAASGVSTDANPANGSFCLPVTLLAGKANQIEVRAQDPVLGVSEPATITVVQKACTGGSEFPSNPTPTQEVSKNVAYGAPAKSMDTPSAGNGGFLTDEKTTTSVVFKQDLAWYNPCNWCDYNGWVSIKLDKLYEVSKIVVRWRDRDGSGTSYGGEYKVLVSSMSDPGDPNLTNGYWQEIVNVADGDGGLDTHDLASKKPVIQHVAIWMIQDGLPWTQEGWGMEEFAISELEVWDAPKKTTTTAPTTQAACQ